MPSPPSTAFTKQVAVYKDRCSQHSLRINCKDTRPLGAGQPKNEQASYTHNRHRSITASTQKPPFSSAYLYTSTSSPQHTRWHRKHPRHPFAANYRNTTSHQTHPPHLSAAHHHPSTCASLSGTPLGHQATSLFSVIKTTSKSSLSSHLTSPTSPLSANRSSSLCKQLWKGAIGGMDRVCTSRKRRGGAVWVDDTPASDFLMRDRLPAGRVTEISPRR